MEQKIQLTIGLLQIGRLCLVLWVLIKYILLDTYAVELKLLFVSVHTFFLGRGATLRLKIGSASSSKGTKLCFFLGLRTWAGE